MELARRTQGLWSGTACCLRRAHYADKGVTITAADLAAIARNSPVEVPVKIEHLAESPFDGALGVVTKLRAAGSQLWGVLRQPLEAWRFLQRTGARSLSVGLDVAGMRLAETSFVCHPRVANAQVFRQGNREQETGNRIRAAPSGEELARFETGRIYREGGRDTMSSVKQLAEGLIGYLRGVSSEEPQSFAVERAALDAERAQLRTEWADRQIMEWKRQGKIRGSEKAAELARTLLTQDDSSVVAFDGKAERLSGLFAAFVQENGPTVPMGERMATDRFSTLTNGDGATARERLIALAREKARAEGLGYVPSFAAVAAANPEMARAARED